MAAPLFVGDAVNSPSETAISGYAGHLQSLRSNVVSPHTHSCRFPWDLGLQELVRIHLFFAAPMVGAAPDDMGAQRLAKGGVPASGAGSENKNGPKAVFMRGKELQRFL